jgi:signal peptidase I
MNNTYHTGDRVLILKNFYSLKHNDIVVFQKGKENLIKRCVGLPGETIAIKNGKIYADNYLIPLPQKAILGNTSEIDPFSLSEIHFMYGTNWTINNFGSYKTPLKGFKIPTTTQNLNLYGKLIEEDNTNKNPILKNTFYTFQNNYIFLIGDNRVESVDSRFYGPIKESALNGKVIFKIF